MSAMSAVSFELAKVGAAYSSTSVDGDTTGSISGDSASWVDVGSPAGWGGGFPLTPTCRVKNTFIDGFEGDDDDDEDEDGGAVRSMCSMRSMPARLHAVGMHEDEYLPANLEIPTKEDGLHAQLPEFKLRAQEQERLPPSQPSYWTQDGLHSQLPEFKLRAQEQERLPPSQPSYWTQDGLHSQASEFKLRAQEQERLPPSQPSYWTQEQVQQDWLQQQPAKQEMTQSRRWADEPVAAEEPARHQQTGQHQQQQKPREPRKLAGPDVVPVEKRVPEMSIGSEAHASGECKPCAWFWRPQGCGNGGACRHCHLCGMGEVRQRRKQRVAARKVEGA